MVVPSCVVSLTKKSANMVSPLRRSSILKYPQVSPKMSVLVDCASNAEVNNDMNVDTHSTIEVGSDGSDGGASTDPDYIPSNATDEDSAFDPVAPSVQEAYDLRRALALSLRVVPVAAPVVVEGSRSSPIVIGDEEEDGPDATEEEDGPDATEEDGVAGTRSAPIVIGDEEEEDGPYAAIEEIDRFGNVVNPWVEDARVRDSEGHLVDAVDRATEEGVDIPVPGPIEAPVVDGVDVVESVPVDGVHAVGVVRHPRNRLGRSGAALGLGGRSGRRRRR